MAVLCLLATGAGALGPAATAAPLPCSSDSDVGDRIPILFVHGFNSDESAWSAALERFCTDTTFAATFNYVDASAAWVTDARIAPELAQRILDLGDASRRGQGPGKVLLVGHSMGGLAIRCAADGRCSGVGSAAPGHASSVAETIGAITTFGTPNLGTYLKGYGSSVLLGAIGRLLSALCYGDQLANWGANDLLNELCGDVRALGTSDAGEAFTPGSDELASLPSQPAGVPVLAVAGSVSVHVSLFGQIVNLSYKKGATGGGDIIVGDDSALAQGRRTDAQGGTATVDCGTLTIGITSHGPWDSSKLDCWHGTETSNDEFLDQVQGMVDGWTASQFTVSDAWWRNQTLPTGWESGETVTFRDGRAVECSGDSTCAYSLAAVDPEPETRTSPPMATVLLYGHGGDGWPLGQTILVMAAEADRLVLYAASDTMVGIDPGRELCDVQLSRDVAGNVTQNFTGCLDPSEDGAVVWQLTGALLRPL